MAYKLDLPATTQVHPELHVSQLKPFVPSYIPAFDKVSKIPDLVQGEVIPLEIVDKRLVKKGNVAVTQILVKWSGVPADCATWEDYHVLKQQFPTATIWDKQSL